MVANQKYFLPSIYNSCVVQPTLKIFTGRMNFAFNIPLNFNFILELFNFPFKFQFFKFFSLLIFLNFRSFDF